MPIPAAASSPRPRVVNNGGQQQQEHTDYAAIVVVPSSEKNECWCDDVQSQKKMVKKYISKGDLFFVWKAIS